MRILLVLFPILLQTAWAANFVNLDFDQGPSTSPTVDADAAVFLPGWHLTYWDQPVSLLGVNTLGSLGNAGSAVLNGRFNALSDPFEGKYSLSLMNGFFDGTVLTWKLEQDAAIPQGANSIWYKTYFEPLGISLNHQELRPIESISEGGFTLFAADISGYAGQQVELQFYTKAAQIQAFQDTYGIDSISFSSTIVPEPNTSVLFLFGFAVFFVGSGFKYISRKSKMQHTSIRSRDSVFRHVLSAISIGSILYGSVSFGADFINLDFDSAVLTTSRSDVPVREALVGWQLRYAGHPCATIAANTLGHLGASGFAILCGRSSRLAVPLEGSHCLLVKNGLVDGSVLGWELSQDGTIPGGTRSLIFKTFRAPFSLRVDGSSTATKLVAQKDGLTTYAADVTAYAGKQITLTFYTLATGGLDTYGIDSVQFSADEI